MSTQNHLSANKSSVHSSKEIPNWLIEHNCEDHQIQNFKIASFDNQQCTASEFEEKHKHEYFEIIWLKNGKGIHQIDLHDHPYEGSVLFVLAPGQIHQIHPQNESPGYVIKFLPSIFKYEQEFIDYILDTCLFDSKTSCPVMQVDQALSPTLESIFQHLSTEYNQPDADSENILSSYLKVLITHIHRIKKNKLKEEAKPLQEPNYQLFRSYKINLEKNYKKEHSVQFYAGLLNLSPRNLNTISRKYANKSAGENYSGTSHFRSQTIFIS